MPTEQISLGFRVNSRFLLTKEYLLWVVYGPVGEVGPNPAPVAGLSRGSRANWKPGINIVPRCMKFSGVCLLKGTAEDGGVTQRTLVSNARS